MLQSDRHRAAGGDTEPSRLHTETDSEPDHDDKYVKRTGSVKRSLQRVMPTMFQPSLPVTTRYQALKQLYSLTLCSSIMLQPVLCADADEALHVTSSALFPLILLWRCTRYPMCCCIVQAIMIMQSGPVGCTAHETVVALCS